MSAKPASVPRWATTGSIVVPASGKQDVGHVAGERPCAEHENWLKNLGGLWDQYLSDGAFSGASSFDNTLGVTGLITATAGLTAAANQHVTVSGTGLFKHGTVTMPVPIHTPQNASIAPPSITLVSPNFVSIPIHGLRVGQRILAVRAQIHDSATGPTKLVCRLRTHTPSSSSTSGTGSASAGTCALQTIASTALTVTVAAGTIYFVEVAFSTGSTNCTVDAAEVDFDQP